MAHPAHSATARAPHPDAVGPAGALSGLKILDFSTLYPGPMATVMLADLGADVLRVEAPDRPDLLRYMPPYDEDGEGAAYRMINRNKRSIVVNLKAPGAADLIGRLVQDYDIVVEQFRPGVLDRLGVGFAALRQVNPKLIWCSITAYGQTGPLRDRPGHDINFLAMSGIAAHTGRPDTGPTPSNALLGDVGGGTFSAITGILAAVIHRMRTGEGQYIDISMSDGALWLNGLAAAGALTSGEDLQRCGGTLNGGSPYDYYQCRDGGWLAVGALEPKFWADFCTAIGRPDLVDHDTSHPDGVAEVKYHLRHAIGERDLVDWQGVFAGVQCCVDAVISTREAVHHPHYVQRGMIVDVPRPGGGRQRQLGSPIHLSACPPRYEAVAALPGEHTAEVLREIGLDAAAVDDLRTRGVVP